MASELCEKVAGLGLATFAIATCAPATPGLVVAGGAIAAGLYLPSILKTVFGNKKPEQTLAKLASSLDKTFDALCRSGELRQEHKAPAEAAVLAVVDQLNPSPELIIKGGRGGDVIAQFLVGEAATRNKHDFADDPLDQQKQANRMVLKALVGEALSIMLEDESFERDVNAWFQRDVLATIRRTDETLQELAPMIRELYKQRNVAASGLDETVIIALARRIAPSVETADQAMAQLSSAVDVAIEVQEEAARGSNFGDHIDETLRRLAELNREQAFDEAAKLADDEIARFEEEQEERKALGIRLYQAGIRQDVLTGDAKGVAEKAVKRVLLEAEDDNTFEALRAEQDIWFERGRDKGINFDLRVSIDIAYLVLGRARDKDERGAAQNDLGIALSILGERESGTKRLEEAVTAYRAALEERTRERVPLDWAMTQNNLGNALRTLGERESDTKWLEEAVTAYRAALEEYTRERVPLDWAMTQNNLGTALKTLGERESGTERLEESVTAYRAALEEWTRERVPLDWAMAQNNLGTALQSLGERESDTERLEEAVKAYHAALEERKRECVPLNWAMTQNNLGGALSILGERESGTERLEEAVKAYRAALEERTRERVPINHASTHYNLAIVYHSLFEKTGDDTHLKAALEALADAEEIFIAAQATYYMELTAELRAIIDDLLSGN